LSDSSEGVGDIVDARGQPYPLDLPVRAARRFLLGGGL